jgi:murein DD-endopeptidase MepM/ murein hydrolase activator NlpD
MGAYDKAVDGLDDVSKSVVAAKTGGGDGAGSGVSPAGGAAKAGGGAGGLGGKIAGKATDTAVGGAIGKVDQLVHSSIDKAVEAEDRLKRGGRAPRTRVGQALREDGKAIRKGALGGAYEGMKFGGVTGAMWEGGRGALVAALRSRTAHKVFGTGAKATVVLGGMTVLGFFAFTLTLIVLVNMAVTTVQSTWVYKAGEKAIAGKELLVDQPAAFARDGIQRAQDAAEAAAGTVEWTVGFAVDKATGVIEEVSTGDGGSDPAPTTDPSADPTTDPTASASQTPGIAEPASATTTGSIRTAESVREDDGVYWVDGQQIAVGARYGVPLGAELPQTVWLLAHETAPAPGRTLDPTAAPTVGPAPTTAPSADPTDGASDPEAGSDGDSSDEEEVKNYDIDEDKARELGLTPEEYEDSEYMAQFVANHVGTRVAELGREDGLYPNLNTGVLYDLEGVGFVPDSDADRNQAVRAIYQEAISELPIIGIEDKAEQIVQEAARLWMGQTCAAPGSGGGGSDGTFTGEGVPEHAIPWIERAAGTSKYKIPAAFFAFIIKQETDFREDTGHVPDSNGGTRGIFQMNQMLWKKYYGHPWGADLNNNGKADENEGMIAAEVGAKYFDERLETVRGIREKNSGKPLATELTDLEALLIAHNAGESRLLSYPRIPAITKKYLENYRQMFEQYGGGSPSDTPGSGGGGSDSGSDSDSGSGSDSGGSSSAKLVKPQGEWPKTSDRGTRWGRFHAGTDYGMPSGTPLPAMFDGTVTFSGWMNGYGNILIVKGTWDGQTLGYAYAHMTSSKVSVGREVKAGDLIGISGNTGVGTGPHLHLELRTDGWAQGGREHNTADAHAFLESNGGEIIGSPTTPDGGGSGEDQACGDGSSDTPTGVPEGIPAEKCDGNAGKVENGLAANGVNVVRAICGSFPEVKNWSGLRRSSIIGNKSDHYTGHAVDAMVNHSGSNDSELGGRIADYLIENADALNVRYIIWEQQIWYPGRDWKKMADRGNETQNHFDHVHVSVNK